MGKCEDRVRGQLPIFWKHLIPYFSWYLRGLKTCRLSNPRTFIGWAGKAIIHGIETDKPRSMPRCQGGRCEIEMNKGKLTGLLHRAVMVLLPNVESGFLSADYLVEWYVSNQRYMIPVEIKMNTTNFFPLPGISRRTSSGHGNNKCAILSSLGLDFTYSTSFEGPLAAPPPLAG